MIEEASCACFIVSQKLHMGVSESRGGEKCNRLEKMLKNVVDYTLSSHINLQNKGTRTWIRSSTGFH